MRPPICAICGNDFREAFNEGGMIHFKFSETDIEFNKSVKNEGITGHPAGLEWFCGIHFKIAKKYRHLHLSDALVRIKEHLS